MEHGDEERAEEQLHTKIMIKTEVEEAVQLPTAYVEIEINVNQLKQELGVVQFVKKDPAFLVKEEILDDSREGTDEHQGVPATLLRAITERTSVAANNVEHGELFHIKENWKEVVDIDLDIGPTVLQHKDSRYITDQIDSNDIKQENTMLNLDPEKILSRIHDGHVVKNLNEDTIESSWKDNAPLVQCISIMPMNGVVQSQIYTCDMCKKTFKTKVAHQSHVKRVHGTSQLKCSECNKYFRCQQYLHEHIVNVHGTSRFTCPECNKHFKCRQYLNEHILNVHGQQQKCDICGKVFKCMRNMAKHIRLVHRNKAADNAALMQCNSITSMKGVVQSEIYTCDVCKKNYKSKEAVRSHVKHVHETSGCVCPECNKHFRCQKYLHNHIVNVHSRHQYKCEICGKVLKSMKILTRHIKFVHENKTEDSSSLLYTCDCCLKKFHWKYLLVAHLEKMHGNKSYRCKVCKKSFGCQLYLSRHAKRVHGVQEHKPRHFSKRSTLAP